MKNYANINQSLEFQEGKTLRTVSPLNTILASVEITEELSKTFPIYELNRFLGTLSLFNNPELDFMFDIGHESESRTSYAVRQSGNEFLQLFLIITNIARTLSLIEFFLLKYDYSTGCIIFAKPSHILLKGSGCIFIYFLCSLKMSLPLYYNVISYQRGFILFSRKMLLGIK